VRSGIHAASGNGGFTLPEVLLAALLAIAALAAAFAAYSGTLRSFDGTATLAELQREASMAVEVIARDVRSGSSVTVGGGGDSLNVYYYTGSYDSLAARYYLDGHHRIINLAGAPLAERVSALDFSTPDGRVVNMDVLVEDTRRAGDGDDIHVLMSSTVACRN
jgi:type II secretory pathway pseudopilin PulG